MSEPTKEQVDAVLAELGIAFPLRNELTIAKALVEARTALTLATQRAEAAEAERDAALKWVDENWVTHQQIIASRKEADALRKVDDAMIERAYAVMHRCYGERVMFSKWDIRDALHAALAVQPTTEWL